MLTVTTNSSARTGPHSRVLPQWENGQMGEGAKGLEGRSAPQNFRPKYSVDSEQECGVYCEIVRTKLMSCHCTHRGDRAI